MEGRSALQDVLGDKLLVKRDGDIVEISFSDWKKDYDGQLVCIHDGTVDRTTTGTGKVADLTMEEIRRLDAGSWFDPKFAGEKVPTIEEVLKLVAEYQQHDVLIAVDLKAEGVEQEVVRLAEKHKVLHRLLFIGKTISEPDVRDRIKQSSARGHTAVVANNAEEFPAHRQLKCA